MLVFAVESSDWSCYDLEFGACEVTLRVAV